MWKTKAYGLLAILIVSGCQPEMSADDQFCYRLAIFDFGQSDSISMEQYIKLLDEMGTDYAGHQTLYAPIIYDEQMYYGGYCDVVTKWDEIIARHASISPVDKAIYDAAYVRSGGTPPR